METIMQLFDSLIRSGSPMNFVVIGEKVFEMPENPLFIILKTCLMIPFYCILAYLPLWWICKIFCWMVGSMGGLSFRSNE